MCILICTGHKEFLPNDLHTRWLWYLHQQVQPQACLRSWTLGLCEHPASCKTDWGTPRKSHSSLWSLVTNFLRPQGLPLVILPACLSKHLAQHAISECEDCQPKSFVWFLSEKKEENLRSQYFIRVRLCAQLSHPFFPFLECYYCCSRLFSL